ncbi:MAG: HAD-IA family hydrolase [Anaerolineae bacterium]
MTPDTIDSLIWDAGGTLFDSYPAVVTACRAALAEFDVTVPVAWLMELFRTSTSHAVETLARTYALDPALLEQRYRAAYRMINATLQPPFPHVREICAYVCERGGENFIVTHRQRTSLDPLLEAHDMARFFKDIITKEDPYPRKPNPASLSALVQRHRLQPERCLAIGDREIDIIAANKAGMRSCFFGREPHETPADLEIYDFGQLLLWLKAGEMETASA